MIYITGDTHGLHDVEKLSPKGFPIGEKLSRKDFLIIAGDFGGVWYGDERDDRTLDFYKEKEYTVLFIDGNHENFNALNGYPMEEWNGGKVHEIRPSVLHLMRGEIFKLQGKSFFTFGGASSHDISDGILDPEEDREKINIWSKDYFKMFRINRVSWWKEELPSEEEMQHGIDRLNAAGNEVDYVVSHCCPQSVASVFSHGFYKSDVLTRYFDGLINNGLTFRNWFFGHYHDDKQIMIKYIMLYDQIIQIV